MIFFLNFRWVLPDTLAQAGFYHEPAQLGAIDDRTLCFVCNLCLISWEQSDQPWSEHERHSPMCHFVRGEYTIEFNNVNSSSITSV